MMKSMRWIFGALLLVVLALGTASAIPPRKDINPALLYWQAFSLFPELDETESTLLGRDTTGTVSEEEKEIARRFDESFKLLLRARTMKTECDWGSDPADGPDAFVPKFTRIRTAARAAVLRARIALADGRQTQARDELLAASALGRNGASGASLVGTMIQVAVDGLILDFISAHFDELKPQIRVELTAGLNGAPTRRTVADAIANEQAASGDWLTDKLESFRANERDDANVLEQFRALLSETFKTESDLADRIIEASGGTSAGVIRYLKGVEPFFGRALRIARASASDIKREMAEFEKAINANTNLIVRMVMPNIGKARAKELEFEARLSRLPNAAP
jgi:hypothetical protein